MTKRQTTAFRVAAAVAVAALMVQPTVAGQAQADKLNSYVGNWKGEGALVGGSNPEPFRCRLSIKRGNKDKINYAGRCTLVSMNLSVSGTISYEDDVRRYQALMSSNAGFTGVAMGREEGNAITFDLAEREKDRGGNDIRIGSKLWLQDETIRVDFEVEFNNSGQVLTAQVPFSR
ncbi:hypothetical protein [Devosia sp.]|uniref:hypothetical protein n=1 Tax=Devosia sp. TaxID=1871048 RepID=UPI003A8CF621